MTSPQDRFDQQVSAQVEEANQRFRVSNQQRAEGKLGPYLDEVPVTPETVGAAPIGGGAGQFRFDAADARARPGRQRDLEAAAGLGMQSIDLAESLDSTRGTDLLHDLYLRMQPQDQIPAVRDFLERAKLFFVGLRDVQGTVIR